MFEPAPILWLQSFASPALTAIAAAISLLGYTRVYVAFAVVLAFTARLRPAVALIILLALNGVIIDTLKATAAFPRPDSLRIVQSFDPITAMRPEVGGRASSFWGLPPRFPGAVERAPTPMPASVDTEDQFGFPSGHVSAATTFLIGLAVLFGWRWAWTGSAIWVPLMALSRMYLGRHFLGDVLGGAVAGVGTLGLGIGMLNLDGLAQKARPAHRRAGRRVLAIALVLTIATLLKWMPGAHDAGRLLGTVAALVVIIVHDVDDRQPTRAWGALLVVLAAASFGMTWAIVRVALDAIGRSELPAGVFATAAIPSVAMLIAPIWVACPPKPEGEGGRCT